MSAAELPRCRWCRQAATSVNYWGSADHSPTTWLFCALDANLAKSAEIHPREWVTGYYSRYEAVLVAELGDELWCALECWVITLAGLREHA